MNHNAFSGSHTATQTFLQVAVRLSWFVVVLAMPIALLGVFYNDLYRDNAFIKAVWQGNDFITAFVVSPLLLYAMLKSHQNPVQQKTAFIIWMGCLWYMIYNYIFYVYGAAFNLFFLGYIAIVIASALALLYSFIAISGSFESIVPRSTSLHAFRSVRYFMNFTGFLLGGAWIALSLSFVITGVVPEAILQTGHPTGVVFATDLIFLITPLLVISHAIKAKYPWAYLLAPILLVKCCLYPFVLVVAGGIAFVKTGMYDVLIPVYCLLGIGAAYALKSCLRRLNHETLGD